MNIWGLVCGEYGDYVFFSEGTLIVIIGQRSRPNSANSRYGNSPPIDLNSSPSLCDNLDTRCKRARPIRIKSAPPLRQTAMIPTPPTNIPSPCPPPLMRRRSFSQSSFPSRGEMLKSIFTVFPAPQPHAVSKRAARPSSAVTLRAGKYLNWGINFLCVYQYCYFCQTKSMTVAKDKKLCKIV